MRKFWYIYKNGENIGMVANKHLAFKALEAQADRKWSTLEDKSNGDRITLGEYEARLEGLK